MCENLHGPTAPFCDPVSGSTFAVGDNVTVTWDPAFFPSSDTEVRLQADVTPGQDAGNTIGQEAFTSEALLAGAGSFVWTIPASMLTVDGGEAAQNATQATLVLANGTGSINTHRVAGPVVHLVAPTSADGSDSGGGSQDAAARIRMVEIILPIVVGVLALVGVVGALMYRRRRRSGAFGSSRQQQPPRREGFAIRKSRIQLVKGSAVTVQGDGVAVEMGGGNAFREELRRQERIGVR